MYWVDAPLSNWKHKSIFNKYINHQSILIIDGYLMRYIAQFQSSCQFVLVVEEFKVWDYQIGFHLKTKVHDL